jgi:ADP-ribosylglycohydrolase
MRAAPAGLLHGRDPAGLQRMAAQQARITHADPRCAAGAIVIAGAAAAALHDERFDAAELCDRLAAWTAPLDPPLAAALARLPQWARLAPAAAYAEIVAVGEAPAYADGWDGISGFVTPSVLWSLYAVLRSPDDYWETICTAIAVGGDVDTTAAMAGAIAGARHGPAALPAAVLACLNDHRDWKAEALTALAQALDGLRRRLAAAAPAH